MGKEEGERRERGTNILEHSGHEAHIPMCDNHINYMYIHCILLLATFPILKLGWALWWGWGGGGETRKEKKKTA